MAFYAQSEDNLFLFNSDPTLRGWGGAQDDLGQNPNFIRFQGSPHRSIFVNSSTSTLCLSIEQTWQPVPDSGADYQSNGTCLSANSCTDSDQE